MLFAAMVRGPQMEHWVNEEDKKNIGVDELAVREKPVTIPGGY